ncbi:G-D-S-L family lipolytic protein [Tamlana sp. 2_MG-2023]|uniref:G-D-S-L family lipolytic protein n=1 Tax=unclassified Tamlana TaxID=2614803 RepID=UPI0026E44750|nr:MULTISPECIES: G-D-S-L family lipolytic protein [unclassified Tamlana]MDO6760496.1 G-D-S-L family lipolytic protein [Tamlana sp. 2_MG-2023]MDO6790752.1 G-D-S-L family lipolytic protein [Tamlana sp. 1_MG-2023]
MIKTKYIGLILVVLGFTACNSPEDVIPPVDNETVPELESGTANFEKYVSVGASLTAGYSDFGLFIAGQENSFPNMLASQFENVGGGEFTQPLVSDNTGGILVGGTPVRGYRLTFNSEIPGPQPLNEFLAGLGAPVPPITTEAGVNIGSDFNNFGIPGAKSFHLIAPGYAGANPYYARIASAPTATVIDDAIAQNPTFFTLSDIGAADVLGYALSGGDDSDAITDVATFNGSLEIIVDKLTANGAKGVIANVPDILGVSHFTTVNHNPVPLDAATAGYLNSANAYGAYNAGIVQAYAYLVANTPLTQEMADEEIAKRTITFAEAPNNALVIMDEDLRDLTALNPALVNLRQATSDDLILLTASSEIPKGVGVSTPMGDNFVLTPEEQNNINDAAMGYNLSIEAVAQAKGLAVADLKSVIEEASTNGITFDDYFLNTDLVFGGLVSLDGVHLTARGYALMGNTFLKAIDETYGSNFEASGNLMKAGDYPTSYSPTLE